MPEEFREGRAVRGDTTSPTVSVSAAPNPILPGETSIVHVTFADDELGVVLDSVTLDGSPITLGAGANYAFSSSIASSLSISESSVPRRARPA